MSEDASSGWDTPSKLQLNLKLKHILWPQSKYFGFRLSTRFVVVAGICSHSDTRASVRCNTDVGRSDLAHSRRSSPSQRCWIGLRSELCTGQSRSSPPNWENLINILACCIKIYLIQDETWPQFVSLVYPGVTLKLDTWWCISVNIVHPYCLHLIQNWSMGIKRPVNSVNNPKP